MSEQPVCSQGDDGDPPPELRLLRFGEYRGPDAGCPPEYADMPVREVFARIDADRRQRAVAENKESLAAGFLPRTPLPSSCAGSGFESGGVLDRSAPDGPLAGMTDAATRDGRLGELSDDELIGVLRAWRRLESWSSAGPLAVAAELARRRPADRT